MILIIDDEEMIRTIAERILRQGGFETITAEDGMSAVTQFADRQEEINLILLDFYMSGMTGVDTLQAIREISPDVPCIFSSGSDFDESSIPIELRHNMLILRKPYRSRQLLEAVSEALAKSRAIS